jgi:hypothetical protein
LETLNLKEILAELKMASDKNFKKFKKFKKFVEKCLTMKI